MRSSGGVDCTYAAAVFMLKPTSIIIYEYFHYPISTCHRIAPENYTIFDNADKIPVMAKETEINEKKLPAKLCYTHLGGKLGSLLLEQFIAKGWIEKAHEGDKNYFVTNAGIAGFSALGIDLSMIKSE